MQELVRNALFEGRHRGREGKLECTLCGAESESVVHVLWEGTAYSSRASFTPIFFYLVV